MHSIFSKKVVFSLAAILVACVLFFGYFMRNTMWSALFFREKKETQQPVADEDVLIGRIGDEVPKIPAKEPVVIDGDALSIAERKKIGIQDDQGNQILVKNSVATSFEAMVRAREGSSIRIQNLYEKYAPISEQIVEVNEKTKFLARKKKIEEKDSIVEVEKGTIEDIKEGMKVTIASYEDITKNTFVASRVEYYTH